ncbi:hypothetical protein C8R43DRAFT_1012433 [Mycena crocata]|nr:hypothetical protein C8R43DRAFT_1012433 [Mycena crocata]
MDTQDDKIDFRLYLPERGWVPFIIPRAKLGQLCRPVLLPWLTYVGSFAYGADGAIYRNLVDENEGEEPTITGRPLRSAPKIPVEEMSILDRVTTIEELPARCYFWSKFAPLVPDLLMISDRKLTETTLDARESWLREDVKERDGNICVFHASSPMDVSHDCVQYLQHLDSWHKHLIRARAGILMVPNKFISKEDVDFVPKGRLQR